MATVKIKTGFRFSGKYYPAGEKQVELQGKVEKFALANGYAVDPAAEKAEADAKAQAEADANKADGNAPENK